jgi:mannose-6-phosphate isomerase-like protein (cupin superfamily)
MKNAQILCNSQISENFFPEGCFISELSNSPQDNQISIAKARVKSGVTTAWHYLIDTVERYVILSGRGEVEVGEIAVQSVAEGDVVLIPPLCKQRIKNCGENDLVFLAICSPRFEVKNYVQLDAPEGL